MPFERIKNKEGFRVMSYQICQECLSHKATIETEDYKYYCEKCYVVEDIVVAISE